MESQLSVKSSNNGCTIKSDNCNQFFEFEFLLQPIVSTDSTIIAFEALSRVHTSNDELICNEKFFEKMSVDTIKSITIEQMKFFDSFAKKKKKLISYNMPISAICDQIFIDKIISSNKNGFAIEITQFDIEFTDLTIICIRDAFKRLQVNGNQIWFDDYINDKLIHRVYVHLFNWDAVKVDKSYILDHKKRKLIDNIIGDIGNVVDKIIIEGVETPYQYHLLKFKKVNIQGFHISKPISEYKAIKFLDGNKKLSIYV